MSYSLGQAKWVPGQISFASLPAGRTGLPSVQPLLEAGLPIAPYIEHGSFTTGEPAIMRYGLDPYRGIMGTDCSGLGCFLSRLFGGSERPRETVATANVSEVLSRTGSTGRSIASSVAGSGTVECNGSEVFRGDALSAMTFAASHSRRNRTPCTARLVGTPEGDRTVQFTSDGSIVPERRRRSGTSGLGQDGGAAEPVKMSFELVVEGEPRGENVYAELSEAADAMAMAFARLGKAGKIVSPVGSENVVADIEPGRGRVRMLHGLGQTVGQSVRRLEAQDYLVLCGGRGVPVRGMRAAMLTGKAALRRNPRAVCRIVLATRRGPGSEVVTLRSLPGGEIDVRFNYALQGMGQLTEFACSETELSRLWQERNRRLISHARIGSALAGVVVGAVGATLTDSNVAVGALAGGLLTTAITSAWIAPHT